MKAIWPFRKFVDRPKAGFRARARAFLGDSLGATAVVFALSAPVLIGAMGLAAEISYWRLHHRNMQNAADAAAIAAATNAGATYVNEAQAVAAQYGFVNGVGNVTVTATNPSSAAGCTSKCYVVQITDKLPIFLASIVGFQGTKTENGGHVTSMAAGAVATAVPTNTYCLLTLGENGANGIVSNGGSKANLDCNIVSNTTATCNGSNLGAPIVAAHTTNNGCGITQVSNAPIIDDPYAPMASKIPSNTCSSYPQAPVKNGDPALPTANQWSGTISKSGTIMACGDQQLTGNTTINADDNAVLVIENGKLDTNGYSLTGKNLTVIFTGSNASTSQHIPTGGGALNITPPTSGNWSGVAMYQDPALTTNVNISAAGNTPSWNLSGLVYLPNSAVTLSGAVGKFGADSACFVLVVSTVTINGTGSIFSNLLNCPSVGLVPLNGGSRGVLVN
jgi:Flp pilus assembly protein TadG